LQYARCWTSKLGHPRQIGRPPKRRSSDRRQLFDERKPLENCHTTFDFRWLDQGGDEHDSLVLSWELLETYRQYRQSYPDGSSRDARQMAGRPVRFGAERLLLHGNLAKRREVYCVTGVFSPPKEVTQNAAFW